MQSINKHHIVLASLDTCTGCSACADVCPKQCIAFKPKGMFLYPEIDEELCIGCERCMKACPVVTPKDNERNSFTQHYFLAVNRDEEERMKATSGGVGGALAKYAIEQGYYVCGASFDGEWYLRHTVSNTLELLDKIRGSKYLQSDTTGIFREILSLVDKGEKILFIGTPCQVEALLRVIPKRLHSQLLTCAIICHGVPSPLVWKEYVKFLEKKHKSKLVNYNFRSKAKGWGRLFIDYRFNKGSKIVVPSWRNHFHTWFGKHLTLRECCLHCVYRQEQRLSDITIGDFWGIERVLPHYNASKGASALVTSSERGQQFTQDNPYLELQEVEAKKTSMVLKGYIDRQPEWKKEEEMSQSKQFEHDFMEHDFDTFIRLYPIQTYWQRSMSFVRLKLQRLLR